MLYSQFVCMHPSIPNICSFQGDFGRKKVKKYVLQKDKEVKKKVADMYVLGVQTACSFKESKSR